MQILMLAQHVAAPPSQVHDIVDCTSQTDRKTNGVSSHSVSHDRRETVVQTHRQARPVQLQGTPVGVLLIDSVEELQQSAAHITGDGAHHAKIIVNQPAAIRAIHSNVAWVGVCSNTRQWKVSSQASSCLQGGRAKLLPCTTISL